MITIRKSRTNLAIRPTQQPSLPATKKRNRFVLRLHSLVVKLKATAEAQVSQNCGGHDFVGLGKVVLGAEQANVFRNDAAAAARERNVVVVVQVVVRPAHHALTPIPLPNLALHFARDQSRDRNLDASTEDGLLDRMQFVTENFAFAV